MDRVPPPLSCLAALLLLLCPINYFLSTTSIGLARANNDTTEPNKTHIFDAFTGTCGQSPLRKWTKAQNAFSCPADNSTNTTSTTKKPYHLRFALPSPYMSDGYKVVAGSFPSYVYLSCRDEKGKLGYCGGVLISSDMVMTAAHCIEGRNACRAQVGFVKMNGTEYRQTRFAQGYCMLPDYLNDKKNGTFNDGALLQMAQPFVYNEHVQPACLKLDEEHDENVQCYAVGWGVINNNKDRTNSLRALPMQRRPCANVSVVLANETGRSCYVASTTQWAGNPCPGDSGGPIYCFSRCSASEEPKMVAVGLISFGMKDNCIRGKASPVVVSDLYKLRKEWTELMSWCYEPKEIPPGNDTTTTTTTTTTSTTTRPKPTSTSTTSKPKPTSTSTTSKPTSATTSSKPKPTRTTTTTTRKPVTKPAG